MNKKQKNNKRPFKGESLIKFPSDYTVIDLETTGLDPSYDLAIELSAIRIRDNKIVDNFSSLVKEEGLQIYDFITELTGITQDMIDSAPLTKDMFPSFLEFIGSDLVIGHNVNFDINFIYDISLSLTEQPFKNDYIDTMRLSRRLLPELKHHRLNDIAEHYSIDTSGSHRALRDCEIANLCFSHLFETMTEKYDNYDNFMAEIKKIQRGLRASDITSSKETFDESHPLFQKVCVFTGTLEKMSRKEAMQIISDVGGINADSVTKKTNFLILGNNDYCASIKDGKSLKQKKAENLKLSGQDIEIMSEQVFYDLID